MNIVEDLTHLKEIIQDEMAKFDFVYTEKKPNMVYNSIHYEKGRLYIKNMDEFHIK